MPRLPEFKLETYFSQWEFTARHHLTASDAQTMSLTDVLALADDDGRRMWDGLTLGYTETWGLPALRQEIAATFDRVAAEDVLCFAGAEEGLSLAMSTLLGRDDHVVVLTPNYQAAESIPLSICAVTGVAQRPEDGWALDVDAIVAALRPNTRMVSVNFPNNPTGAVPDHTAWTQLVQVCEDRGVLLFSDEVYRGLELDATTTLAQAADLSATALSLNVMSKSYGLPGLRIGWIACRDGDILRQLERAKHYASICNSAVSEVLAVIALRSKDAILQRNRSIIADNLPRFDAFFARYPELFEWGPPRGGCVCFPRYLGADGVEAMCTELIEQRGVLLLPASVYRSELTATPPDRFRIGVGRSAPEAALAQWAAFLDERR